MENQGIVKKRIYLFDNIKAILIFLVVFFHLFELIRNENLFNKSLYFFVYAFHMPLFIFVSGYFYNRKKTFKNIEKYLLLYILFQVLYIFYLDFIIVKVGEVDFYNLILIKPIWILWYLMSLCFYSFISYFIDIKNKKTVLISFIISIALAIAVGYVQKIGKDFSMSRNFVFYPYFLLGYYVRQNCDVIEFRNSFFKKERIMKKALVFLASLAVIACYIAFLHLNVWDLKPEVVFNNKSYALSGSNPVLRLLLYLPALSMIFFNVLLIPNKEYKFITNIGTNTLYIFLFHGFIKYLWEMNGETIHSIPNVFLKYGLIFITSILIISGISLIVGVAKFIKKRVKKEGIV